MNSTVIHELAWVEERDRILGEDEPLRRTFRFFGRPSADSCGTPLSWEEIRNHCELAKKSESFYRCRGRGESVDPSPSRHALGLVCVQDQWLHTAVFQQKSKLNDAVKIIRSNVVPRRTYLKRLEACNSTATCPDCEFCMRGFSEICDDQPCPLSCTNCALVKQLEGATDHVCAELVPLLEVTEAGFVTDHSLIASGSQGKVYKICWREGLFARKTFTSASEMQIEMEIAKVVSHPNIVHCFGYSYKEEIDHRSEKVSTCSLYMELLEESLLDRIQERIQMEDPFSFQDIVFVLWQVADAMTELHEKRFIHGDLKPGNILLSRLRMPHSKSGWFYLTKVADFGSAQRMPPDPESADDKSNAAVFCSEVGTTAYTAPEVFRHRVDAIPPKHPQKIDVYSFGVVVYQMLTGVAILYEKYRSNPRGLKAGVMDGTLRPNTDFDTETLDSDRNSLFKSLVVKCWDSDPESRPSFSAIRDDLENLSSKHGENRARPLEPGENGAHQSNKGHKGKSLAQPWWKLKLKRN